MGPALTTLLCSPFLLAEWLGKVIVSAWIEGTNFIAFTVTDGENDDWDLSPFMQARTDFHTIHIQQT